jgi:hypothetical protein
VCALGKLPSVADVLFKYCCSVHCGVTPPAMQMVMVLLAGGPLHSVSHQVVFSLPPRARYG